MVENPKIFRGFVSHADWEDATAEGALQVLGWSLKCEFETGAVEMPFEGLQIQRGAGKIWFTHPENPDWTICSEDQDVLKERPFHKTAFVRQQILEIEARQDDLRRLKATVYFLAGFFLIAFMLMNLSGWILNLVVDRIPMAYELQIGADVAKKLEERLDFVSAPGVTNRLKPHLVQLLGPGLSTRYDPQVLVYQSYEPNAFVIPGGYFYISSSLLSLAQTPEEIVGVMAHEAAHLKSHHGIRKLIAQQGKGFLFKWIFGDRQNLLSLVTAGSDLLVNQAYSRELECQAGQQGWEMLLAANIDPRGEIEIFKKLDAFENPSGKDLTEFKILRDHPLTQERINRLTEKWKTCPKKSGFIALEKFEWTDTNSPDPKTLLRLFK